MWPRLRDVSWCLFTSEFPCCCPKRLAGTLRPHSRLHFPPSRLRPSNHAPHRGRGCAPSPPRGWRPSVLLRFVRDPGSCVVISSHHSGCPFFLVLWYFPSRLLLSLPPFPCSISPKLSDLKKNFFFSDQHLSVWSAPCAMLPEVFLV